jgi:4'-phosphopantetheinyl transferase
MTNWVSPREFPVLPANAVHVWRASLDIDRATQEKCASLLSNEERERAERFVVERDRISYVAAHGFLRDVLARYLACEPDAIQFSNDPHGKPAISDPQSPNSLAFNLSHSHGVGVVAITRGREIGVDVENIRPEFASEAVAKRYFSAQEVDELERLALERRAEGFFLCWTRKEAYVKALGEGLRIPLDSFSVSLTPGEPAQLHAKDAGRWGIQTFQVSTAHEMTHVGAVVCEGKDWAVEYLDWGEFEGRG